MNTATRSIRESVKKQPDFAGLSTPATAETRGDLANTGAAPGAATFDLPALGTIKGAATGARLHPDEYQSWHQAVRRCHVKKGRGFEYYGAKNVRVCDRWRRSFLAFVADTGPRPAGTQLDRFPNQSGNYQPGNTRWSTPAENTRNRRNTVMVEWDGKRVALGELTERYRITYDVVRSRLRLGWDLKRALTTPVGPHGDDVKLPYEQRAHVKAATRSTSGRMAAE
jgi:hypothetical protein